MFQVNEKVYVIGKFSEVYEGKVVKALDIGYIVSVGGAEYPAFEKDLRKRQ